jgi:hypothetical protein
VYTSSEKVEMISHTADMSGPSSDVYIDIGIVYQKLLLPSTCPNMPHAAHIPTNPKTLQIHFANPIIIYTSSFLGFYIRFQARAAGDGGLIDGIIRASMIH